MKAEQAIQISTNTKKSPPFASPLRSPSSETQIGAIDAFSDEKRRKFAFGKHLKKSKQLKKFTIEKRKSDKKPTTLQFGTPSHASSLEISNQSSIPKMLSKPIIPQSATKLIGLTQ